MSGQSREAEIEGMLADQVSEFYADFLGFVMFAFPWDTDPSIQVVDWENEDIFVDPDTGICYDTKPNSVDAITYMEWMAPYRARFNSRYGPDRWACDWLDDLSKQVERNGFTGTKAVKPVQMATSSGHGIGKSTLTAWVILCIMSTRPHAKGTVTANTAEQLRTKTWAELGKWHKRCITGHWFQYNSGRGNMNLRHHEKGEEWYCSAQTCRRRTVKHSQDSTQLPPRPSIYLTRHLPSPIRYMKCGKEVLPTVSQWSSTSATLPVIVVVSLTSARAS